MAGLVPARASALALSTAGAVPLWLVGWERHPPEDRSYLAFAFSRIATRRLS
jgi:hypothetical protein